MYELLDIVCVECHVCMFYLFCCHDVNKIEVMILEKYDNFFNMFYQF